MKSNVVSRFLLPIFLLAVLVPVFVQGSTTSVYAVSDGSLRSPEPVQAGPVNLYSGIKTVYDFLANPGEVTKVNITSWTAAVVTAATSGITIAMLCGGDYTDQHLLAQMKRNGKPPDPAEPADRDCITNDQYKIEAYAKVGRTPGGLATVASQSLAYFAEESPIPADMAYFINDSFGNTIFTENAYAKELVFGNDVGKVVFILWKVSRNIAVSLSVLILGIVGLMVMLRTKINPQVVASVYNSLPYVPVGIVFIILSYPIVTFVLSVIGPLTKVGFGIGFNIIDQVQSGMIGTTFADKFTYGLNNLISYLNGTAYINFILTIVALLIAVIVVFLVIFKLIQIYVNFIWYIIAAPFVGLVYMIPGRQSILVGFFKKVLADVLTIPIMILVLIAGFGILSLPPVYSGGLPAVIVPLIALQWVSAFLKFSVGIIFMTTSLKIHKMLKESLGVQKGIFYNPQRR